MQRAGAAPTFALAVSPKSMASTWSPRSAIATARGCQLSLSKHCAMRKHYGMISLPVKIRINRPAISRFERYFLETSVSETPGGSDNTKNNDEEPSGHFLKLPQIGSTSQNPAAHRSSILPPTCRRFCPGNAWSSGLIFVICPSDKIFQSLVHLPPCFNRSVRGYYCSRIDRRTSFTFGSAKIPFSCWIV